MAQTTATHPGRRWLLSGIALLAGCAVGLGFAPTNLWPLVPIGVAGFVVVALASSARVGLLRGYLFGLGFSFVAFRWLSILGLPVVAAMAVWLSVWYALVGLTVAALRRTPVWGFAGVAVWMGAEWIGARWPFGGFGWGRLAYTAADTPLDGLFPLISATGVSLVIVSSAFLLAWVIRGFIEGSHTWRALRPLAVSLTGALILVSALGGLWARSYDLPADGRSVTVAVIQGNVPGVGIEALGPRYTVENNHLAETIILAAQIRTGTVSQPDFVAWPENSTATDPFTDSTTAGIIKLALDLVQVPILVGAITDGPGPDERQTVGLWWTPDSGVTATYAKRNLVPFGEWVPFRSVLMKLVPELTYVGAQSIPGTTPGVLDVAAGGQPLRVGDLICFEVSYDTTVDEMLKGDAATGGGAQVVLVQTSNAMFTGSDQMAQQDRITRIRAMEARRDILVATTNSLAGLIDAHGHVVYQAQLRTSDAQVFTVPTSTALTPAIAYRTWFDLGSVLLPLLGGAAALAWHARRRRIR